VQVADLAPVRVVHGLADEVSSARASTSMSMPKSRTSLHVKR